MDIVDNESICSTNSSDANLPKDYSLSSLVYTQSDKCEANNNINNHNNNNNNNNVLSKSMKLNFGVERLLSKKDYKDKINDDVLDDNLVNRKLIEPSARDSESLINLSYNGVQMENGNNQLGLNLLHQQLIHSDNNGLTNQSFILKPFPIRFGRNHNGYVHQPPPSYFQSNLRKVTMTSNMTSSPAPYSSINNSYHNILRLPSIPQIPQNNSVTQFFNQKLVKSQECNEKPGLISTNGNSSVKRKRSWSRAVFSNLQRKGLERQFEFQKYITKPDRKKLAARLGLKDAQVKVWFQNRRMKWRHSTRGTNISGKTTNSHENSDLNDDDDEHFTSSDEDIDIDVVTDH